jgi:hypothetical protein
MIDDVSQRVSISKLITGSLVLVRLAQRRSLKFFSPCEEQRRRKQVQFIFVLFHPRNLIHRPAAERAARASRPRTLFAAQQAFGPGPTIAVGFLVLCMVFFSFFLPV